MVLEVLWGRALGIDCHDDILNPRSVGVGDGQNPVPRHVGCEAGLGLRQEGGRTANWMLDERPRRALGKAVCPARGEERTAKRLSDDLEHGSGLRVGDVEIGWCIARGQRD